METRKDTFTAIGCTKLLWTVLLNPCAYSTKQETIRSSVFSFSFHFKTGMKEFQEVERGSSSHEHTIGDAMLDHAGTRC